jgi:hypothetical protein
VADEARYEDDVERALADHRIGDRYAVAGSGVFGGRA